MDRFVNKKIEKQTIYEIYRACRLCGAGGGYKMPIIQNVVNLDNCDVELKQKIRECVQIEVHQDDKMPPLICELCVDKVNDFYEFLEMCRQTNKRTRLRLGLPPQMMPRGAPDAGDCILGVTEPIFVNDEDSNEPLSDKRSKARAGPGRDSGRRSKELKVKIEDVASGRESRASRRAPTPPRARRGAKPDPDNVALSGLQSRSKRSQSPPPKSILKKGKKPEASAPVAARHKRTREPELQREVPAKRVKISLKPLPPRTSKLARQKEEAEKAKAKRTEAKRREAKQKRPEAPRPRTECPVCGGTFKSPQAMLSHRRSHGAAATDAKHTEKRRCLRVEEVPVLKCEACRRTFPAQNLLKGHRCPGKEALPAKCQKCGKSFSQRGPLTNHVKHCKKGAAVVPAALRARLRAVRVRVARCDPLLGAGARGPHDVSAVPEDFGLDKSCVYPFWSSGPRIKREPMDCMVKINDLDFGSYVHWDSEDGSGDSDDDADRLDLGAFGSRRIKSLAACALKTIFSPKFLGKVPRKYRRLKIETIIESTLNDSLSDLNLNDRSVKFSDNSDKKVDETDDDLFPMVSSDDKVTNADFDSLFSDNNDKIDSDKSAVADDKLAALGDRDSDGSGNVKESDLDSGAKEIVDEVNNGDSNSICNNNVSVKDTTNETGDKNIDEEKYLDSKNVESEDHTDNANDSEKNVSLEAIKNVEEITDDSQTKVNETPVENHDENVNQVISNESEQVSNKSEELVEDHDSKIDQSIENEQINNEISKESEINEEILQKPTKESKTETEHSVSPNKPEAETEIPNKETKASTDENIGEGNTDNDVNKVNGGAENEDEVLNLNDFEDYSGDEYDDCDLMAEIDAQIGEKKRDEKEKNTDKIDNKQENVQGNDTDDIENKRENVQEKKITEEKIEKVTEAEIVTNDVDKKEIDMCETKEIEISEKKEIGISEMKQIEISEKVNDTTIRQGVNETNIVKDTIMLEDLLLKDDSKSTDLDNISDDEFDFND